MNSPVMKLLAAILLVSLTVVVAAAETVSSFPFLLPLLSKTLQRQKINRLRGIMMKEVSIGNLEFVPLYHDFMKICVN